MKPSEKSHLKSQAHNLKPVVILGAGGLSAGVSSEIDRALEDHELIKIRISQSEREARKAITAQIITNHQATLIGTIGHIIIIYRPKSN
jgi:RNA-binding protein